MNNKINKILCKLKLKWQAIIDTIINGSCGCIRTITVVYLIPEWENCDGCKQETYSTDLDLPVFFRNGSFDYRFGMNIGEQMAKLMFDSTTKTNIESAKYFLIDGKKYEPNSVIYPVGFGNDYDYYEWDLKLCT